MKYNILQFIRFHLCKEKYKIKLNICLHSFQINNEDGEWDCSQHQAPGTICFAVYPYIAVLSSKQHLAFPYEIQLLLQLLWIHDRQYQLLHRHSKATSPLSNFFQISHIFLIFLGIKDYIETLQFYSKLMLFAWTLHKAWMSFSHHWKLLKLLRKF